MPIQEETELRSEEVQEILTKMPHWMIRWGNVVVLLLLTSLFLVSWIIKYPEVVNAEITITTALPPEKLIAGSSGRFEKILIADRDTVQKNTALAVIENTSDYKDVFFLKACLDSIDLNRIVFPLDRMGNLELGTIESSYAVFEKEYQAYLQYKDLKPHSIEESSQSFELLQLGERLQLLLQQKEISKMEQSLKMKDLDRYRRLHEKGIISTQEWEAKSIDYLQQEKNLRSMSTQISVLRSSINQLKTDSSNTTANKTRDDINLFQNIIHALQNLKAAISDWDQAYVLRSSIAGQVSYLQVWNENQTVKSGENVFTVIPVEARDYVGKVKAPAKNSGKLKVGQPVQIRLSNYPDQEFGVVEGRVKSISMIPDKDGNILLDVVLPKGLETSYGKQIQFQQEMSGTANIITEDLRLAERLLYQFRKIFQR